jgi:hypothetical protein
VRGKVWLASKRNKNGSYSKIVGDERHWRVHIPEAAKVDEDARRALAAKAPLADIWQTELQPRRPSGLRCRLCIEAEKELQVLGYGWRIVTCQLRGTDVLLHHNGNTAKLKRGAFKGSSPLQRTARSQQP